MNYDLSPKHIMFYANEIVTKGWSRDMLRQALKSEYHLSFLAEKKSNNFTTTLPKQQAEYANEIFRSCYNLGFIDAVEPLKELDLEKRLVQKITTFIMELGSGFSFIGNQYTLTYNTRNIALICFFPPTSSFNGGH